MTADARARSSGGRGGGEGPARHTRPPTSEWVVAAVGAALVAATLGVLVHEALTMNPDATPRLTVRVDTIVADRSGYTVEYRAVNDGDATAARVLVRGELRDAARVVEQSESTIDFVPARSWRSGGLVFRNDPRAYRMELRPIGFDRP